MANRAMAGKVERARKQAIAAASIEYSKPLWSRHETIEAANAKRRELVALQEKFTGAVTVGAPCPVRPEPIGKTRRQFQRATYGNGRRFEIKIDGEVPLPTGAKGYYDLWDTSDRLIRNGEVVKG